MRLRPLTPTLPKPALGAVLAAAALFGFSSSSNAPPAFAASGCADIDGDGVVHAVDITLVTEHFGQLVPPAPPQVDLNKDSTITVADGSAAFGAFDMTTSCQADPLPKSTAAGGALAVDANGESPVAGDTVEASRTLLVGDTFHVAAYLTQNPGIVAYQARVHWDEAVLDLNPRSASENDTWAENAANIGAPVASVQVLGPADDGSGSEAYVELVTAPVKSPSASSLLVIPLAQFEFTCEAAGSATITLAGPGTHTNLVDIPPATEYTPTLTGAQIICLEPDADDDMDGCTNAQELGPNERFGGRRDPLSFWDFIDLWTGSPFVRDKVISVGDIGASVARFGRQRPGGPPAKNVALAEALTPPTTINGYHASADRSGSIPGQDRWDLRPPDGQITVGDHGVVVASFGHSCL